MHTSLFEACMHYTSVIQVFNYVLSIKEVNDAISSHTNIGYNFLAIESMHSAQTNNWLM